MNPTEVYKAAYALFCTPFPPIEVSKRAIICRTIALRATIATALSEHPEAFMLLSLMERQPVSKELWRQLQP